ncbi:MAG: tol-pal system protein YbgF [Gallionella sp.]|nr:tol-pal system protein YbgF [Gallionella sp.]
MLLALCVAAPAQAGLFSDDEARKQIQQLETRAQQLETRVLKLEERAPKLEGDADRQNKSLMDLQGQIETLNREIRNLRGQNEELARGLQDAEKREKDFYVDLDTRLRHFESKEEAMAAAANANLSAANTPADPFDPTVENRAFELAYGLFKDGKFADAVAAFQGFINKYPESVHVPNANYWIGSAQFALHDYQSALGTYQGLINVFPSIPRAADVLFSIAECQRELKQSAAAQKTLKQLAAKYPGSEAAAKAKELIAAPR